MPKEVQKILSEISAGELLDKISILEIKLDKVINKNSHKVISKEYMMLKNIQRNNIKLTNEIKKIFNEIKKVNLKLWNIEDKIRVFEKNKKFNKSFISLARSVYLNNDKRSKLKLKINNILNSNIKEVKIYSKY